MRSGLIGIHSSRPLPICLGRRPFGQGLAFSTFDSFSASRAAAAAARCKRIFWL